MHTVITQLVQGNTGTSPEDPLKVLKFGTYRGPSRESQGANTKIYGLWFIDKIVFQKQYSLYYIFISFFAGKTNSGDVREAYTRSSCGMSRRPNNGTFKGRPRDVGQNIF